MRSYHPPMDCPEGAERQNAPMDVKTLDRPDGTTLVALVDGDAPAGAELLVYHHGTPAAGPADGLLLQAARAAGFRLVEVVRPGYGPASRQPGRTVADVVPMVEAWAAHLGAERFATIGRSGGGPHAIATAALLPGRCVGALSLAGVAPYQAEGLDWTAGMGQDNLDEFAASAAGEAELEAFLAAAHAGLSTVTGADVVEQMASLLPEVDREHLVGGFGDHLAAQIRWSLSTGIWGWFDDELAFIAPWGFDLVNIEVPVLVWQGSDDLMVPFAHGQWLAASIPGAVPHLKQGEGHLSLAAGLQPGLEHLRSLL